MQQKSVCCISISTITVREFLVTLHKHHFFFSSVKVEEISNCPFINYFHNNFNIILPTNVHIVKATVFPVVMYKCESWTIKKAEHQRIDAF